MNPDPELEKLSLAHITAAARSIFTALDSAPERGAPPREPDDEQDNLVGRRLHILVSFIRFHAIIKSL